MLGSLPSPFLRLRGKRLQNRIPTPAGAGVPLCHRPSCLVTSASASPRPRPPLPLPAVTRKGSDHILSSRASPLPPLRPGAGPWTPRVGGGDTAAAPLPTAAHALLTPHLPSHPSPTPAPHPQPLAASSPSLSPPPSTHGGFPPASAIPQALSSLLSDQTSAVTSFWKEVPGL